MSVRFLEASRGVARAGMTVAVGLALGLATPLALAEDAPVPKPPPTYPEWSDTVDLGLVSTSGNTENTNIAFSNKLKLKWEHSDLEFEVRGLRVKTDKRIIEADFSDPAQPVLNVTRDSEITDAQYGARLSFNQKIHERLGWFTLATWNRNTPAGFDARESVGAGLSYTFPERENRLVRIEAGFTGNADRPVDGIDTSYFGARIGFRFETDLLEKSRIESRVELLENLEDTQDYRAHFEVSLSASLNERFALKILYQARFDNLPESKNYKNPQPDLGPDLLFTFDKLDTVFATSLVARF